MANFEVFLRGIKLSINLIFLKSDITTTYYLFIKIKKDNLLRTTQFFSRTSIESSSRIRTESGNSYQHHGPLGHHGGHQQPGGQQHQHQQPTKQVHHHHLLHHLPHHLRPLSTVDSGLYSTSDSDHEDNCPNKPHDNSLEGSCII